MRLVVPFALVPRPHPSQPTKRGNLTYLRPDGFLDHLFSITEKYHPDHPDRPDQIWLPWPPWPPGPWPEDGPHGPPGPPCGDNPDWSKIYQEDNYRIFGLKMTPLPLELFRFGAANLPLPKKGQVHLVQFDPSLERRKRRKYLESIRKVMFLQNILSYIVLVHFSRGPITEWLRKPSLAIGASTL